jgi:hypothetical protein
MKADQITMKQTLDYIKSLPVSDKMGTTWKRRMKEQSNIRLFPGFLYIERNHQQMIILNPD